MRKHRTMPNDKRSKRRYIDWVARGEGGSDTLSRVRPVSHCLRGFTAADRPDFSTRPTVELRIIEYPLTIEKRKKYRQVIANEERCYRAYRYVLYM